MAIVKKKVGCTKDNKEWHCLDSPNVYKSPVITKVSNFLRNSDECREESTDMFLGFSVARLTPAFVLLVLGNILKLVLFVVEFHD